MLTQRVSQACHEVFGQDIPIIKPAHDHFGDFSVNVMQLDPRPSNEQVEGFVQRLAEHPLFEKAERVGAFINVFIHRNELCAVLNTAVRGGERYGSSDWAAGRTWAIEHTSPNPNKAMHLGHLRNNITGMAISNLWEWTGATVIREAVDNNRGIAIAKLMWGYLHTAHKNVAVENRTAAYWQAHQDEWHTADEYGKGPGEFVDELYVHGAEAYKDDEATQEDIRRMVVDWEAGENATWSLWKHVLAYSYAGQERTLQRLGNAWDVVWHEHDHYEAGKAFVQQGLENGVFVRTPEGTIITQLQAYDLPDTVVEKSDGTSLYITQDIALTNLKMKTHRADKLYWVIGPEQSLALKQLFAVCEQLGIGARDQFEHIAYGYMSIKGQGRMSSRSGNVVHIDAVLDEAAERARLAIRNPDDLREPADVVAEKIGVGAVKYSLLKIGRMQDTAFDFDDSLGFDGNSGPYIQYAHARMRSILAKAGGGNDGTGDVGLPDNLNDTELLLLRAIARFPDIVAQAAEQASPHIVCAYVYELTQLFNSFYEASSILEADSTSSRTFRLALTTASAHIVRNSLSILGIDALERM